ncbi:hypothetical protein ACNTMW_15350 [Planosporangium sp. 12N6]|uniref:hypothetical protein n=1 Tax=Planosporangium spinosum TaxID=3402278 RepID=UPI003CFB538E
MTMLEDELRATFSGRVAEVPPVRDRAGTAIARGRAVRRRHRITAGAAAVVAVAVVLSGAWFGGWRAGGQSEQRARLAAPGVPTGSARPSHQIRLDLVVGGELRPAGGAPIRLPGTGDVYDAVRTDEGWLVVRGAKATHQLWQVSGKGQAALLIDALPTNFVIADDGRSIAYQQGNTVTVQTIGNGTASLKASFQVPGTDGSQGRTGAELVGWAGGRLVIGNRAGLDYQGFDLLDISSESYTPTFNPAVTGVYVATPDVRYVVGATRDNGTGQTCAARLDPAAGFTVVDRVCGQPYLSVDWHAVSPDGRRFLALVEQEVGIADAATGVLVARVPATNGMWPAVPVWVDSGTFVVAGDNRLLEVDVADPGHPRELPVPSTSERWLVVARAGG